MSRRPIRHRKTAANCRSPFQLPITPLSLIFAAADPRIGHFESQEPRARSGVYIHAGTMVDVIVSGFDWDEDNISHIERHQFTPDEVEEVFVGDHKIRRARQKLYIALGNTLDGRSAFVVFRRQPGGIVRVVTARDMDDSERRLFRRK